MSNWRQLTQTVWSQTLDLVFPPLCQHCGRVDYTFCPYCLADLKTLPVVPITSQTMTPLDTVLSTGQHEGLLQASVQVIKYAGQQSLGEVLAERILEALSTTIWTIDIVVPVPLHTKRLQERGYNQAEAISQHVAIKGNFVHIPEAITRITQTRSQVGLSAQERQENVRGAFVGNTTHLQGKRVLLIDDVKTTGATLAACTQAMLDAGADTVYAMTVSAA
ncbi:MAG: ComF family protein [Chloroflexota bacterium]